MQTQKRDKNLISEKKPVKTTENFMGKFKFFKNRTLKTSTSSCKGLKVSFTSRAFLFFINYSWSEYLFAYMIHWCVVLVCRQCLEKNHFDMILLGQWYRIWKIAKLLSLFAVVIESRHKFFMTGWNSLGLCNWEKLILWLVLRLRFFWVLNNCDWEEVLPSSYSRKRSFTQKLWIIGNKVKSPCRSWRCKIFKRSWKERQRAALKIIKIELNPKHQVLKIFFKNPTPDIKYLKPLNINIFHTNLALIIHKKRNEEKKSVSHTFFDLQTWDYFRPIENHKKLKKKFFLQNSIKEEIWIHLICISRKTSQLNWKSDSVS